VSPSWLERKFGVTTLRLGQDAAWIVPRRGHERDAKLSEVILPEAPQEGPAWQPQVKALQRLLQRQKPALPRRLRIVVSNAFVRYVLAPWTDEQLSDAEQVELVRALFQDRYGDRDGSWHIAVEPQRFKAPALATAIDAEFLAVLQDTCTKVGLHLVSVVPGLIENLYLQRRPVSKAASGWFVDASDNRLATIAYCDGHWANVSNERCAEASSGVGGTLLPMLRRDAILAPDLLNGTVFIANTRAALEGVSPSWPVVRFNGLDMLLCA
jgi:hypothetical protein